MEELRQLAQEFKISLSEFPQNPEDNVAEETKIKIKDFIEKFNHIINSIGRLNKKEDIEDFRSIYFKVKMLRKVAKEYKIDVPDVIIDYENIING